MEVISRCPTTKAWVEKGADFPERLRSSDGMKGQGLNVECGSTVSGRPEARIELVRPLFNVVPFTAIRDDTVKWGGLLTGRDREGVDEKGTS